MNHRFDSTAPALPTDEDLWVAAQEGDEAAFERFYRRHRPLALRVAGAICPSEAEDAVQAAFLSAWRTRRSYNPAKGGARNWMMSVVRNRAIDAIRVSGRRREALVGEAVAEVEDPVRTEQLAVERETADELKAAIAELPARQRRIVQLNYFAGLSQSEIASNLGLPLGTVKGRSRAALKGLAAIAT